MVVAWGNEWVDGEREGPRRMEGRGREGGKKGKGKREFLKLEEQR